VAEAFSVFLDCGQSNTDDRIPRTRHYTDDVLEWWEESEPLPIPRAEAAAAIDQYFREIQVFKVGTIVEVSYGPGEFALTMVARTPRSEDRPLP
jgi:hypothetical protein